MHELFISYRRVDSQVETELLYRQIRQYYCANAIYYDHISLHGGAPFPQDIADAIQRCHVMIVMIGPQWEAMLRVNQTNPEDWVRIEIERAIALGKPIIPVLEPVEKQAEESQRSYPERMTTTSYASDLTDGQWEIRKPFFPVATTGRPRQYPYRTFINAIRYLLRSGSQWRLLPQEFPPWKTVYYYFRHWRIDGTWPRIPTALREQERLRLGRHAQPSASILDSQSVKTTSVGGPRGYDGGKQIRGRKRSGLRSWKRDWAKTATIAANRHRVMDMGGAGTRVRRRARSRVGNQGMREGRWSGR